jgi:signal peptidase I
VVEGISMLPCIKKSDRVIVSHQKKPRTGDVILYRRNKTEYDVVHRVIKMRKDIVITKGDNAIFFDTPIAPDEIKGVVSHVIRKRKIYKVESNRWLGYLWFMLYFLLFITTEISQDDLRRCF